MADAPVTFFIPLGKGRSNAGLTLRAENVDEMNAVLKDLVDSANPDELSKLNDVLDSVVTINAALELKGLNVQEAPVYNSAPKTTHPQATSAPADAPVCSHGAMKWKEGTSKQGNAYKGWFCPAPYGVAGGQCPAKFIK